MLPRLVSLTDFASATGVTRTAIAKACRGKLGKACVDDRINYDHPAALAYLEKKGFDATTFAPTDPIEASDIEDLDPDPETAEIRDITQYMDMTLRELLAKFGTVRFFKDWLEASLKMENVKAKQLDTEERQRKLIHRDYVKTFVIGAMDATFRRLLSDAPRTIASRIASAVKSGATLEENTVVVREIIESQLAPMKAQVAKAIRKGGSE